MPAGFPPPDGRWVQFANEVNKLPDDDVMRWAWIRLIGWNAPPDGPGALESEFLGYSASQLADYGRQLYPDPANIPNDSPERRKHLNWYRQIRSVEEQAKSWERRAGTPICQAQVFASIIGEESKPETAVLRIPFKRIVAAYSGYALGWRLECAAAQADPNSKNVGFPFEFEGPVVDGMEAVITGQNVCDFFDVVGGAVPLQFYELALCRFDFCETLLVLDLPGGDPCFVGGGP